MTIPSLSLKDQVAVITGGSKGIGREIALTFAEAGADIALCSRNVNDARKVAGEIQRLGRRSLAIEANVTVKTDVDNLVKLIEQEFGKIDILVNNAGMLVVSSLMETSEQDWDATVNTNLKGCYLCSQAIGKLMMASKKGIIINMTSTTAFKFYNKLSAYCVTKAGIPMLTKALAKELAPYNIRVNAIAPGVTKTEMSRPLWTASSAVQTKKLPPLGRMGEATDVARLALFLASDLSGFITGDTIIIDGGESL